MYVWMNVPEISVGHPDLREVVMIKTFFLLTMHNNYEPAILCSYVQLSQKSSKLGWL